jgi:hypothetical protein
VGPSTYATRLTVFSRTRRSNGLQPYDSPVTSFVRRNQVRWLRSRQP